MRIGGLTLHSVSLGDVFSLRDSFPVGIVPDGDIGSGFCKRVGDSQPNACTCTRDDCRSALEREEWEDSVGVGWGYGVSVREREAIDIRIV